MNGELYPDYLKGEDLVLGCNIPDSYFEERGKLTLVEREIMTTLFYLTYGFNQFEVAVSYRYLCFQTGISSHSAISNGLSSLLEKGFITRVKKGSFKNPAVYRMKEAYNQEIKEVIKQVRDNEKQKAIEELRSWGGDSEKKELPKKKKRRSFKEKHINEWNANDILYYFASRYYEFIGVPYPSITNKERGLAKKLITESEYSILDIIRVIDYYIKNYETIPNHPKSYPSWSIFWGWRTSIFPTALLGEEKKVEQTQDKNFAREWKDDDGGEDDWVPTDWGGIE